MSAFDPYAPEETKFRREFLIVAAALSIPLGVFLISNPDIDLALSTAFWEMCPAPSAGRPWCAIETVTTARQIFMGFFAIVAFATLIVTLRIVIEKRRWLGIDQARCWFMIAVLIIGPGVVANLVFKENMGRARPRDIVEFGGTKTFTPPLVPSRECARNCSFISGEASSIYAAFFALALLIPQYRMGLLISGIAAGTLAGIVRIIQGAHFLSDVLFAGVFMAITVSLLHIAFIGLWRDPRRIWNAVTAALLPYEGERSNEEARMTESPERNPVHQGEFALPADAIAVVIPALNEAGNIGNLVRETIGCVPAYALREIIVVDDGSNDETPAEVQALLATVPKLRYLRHAIRAGQSAAVRSGVRAASAPLIATMDGDGQNDPHDIPALVALLQKSAHANIALVGGVRTARRAESSKRIASKFANWLRDAILRDNCPDTGCGIKVFRRDAFVDLPYFSGMHRYLPALFQAYGHGAVYHPVNDRPRRAGSSKYTNFGRALLGIYDLIGVRWLIKRTALPNASAPIRRALSDDLPAHTPNEERLWLQN